MKVMQKINRQIEVDDKDVAALITDGWLEIDEDGVVVQPEGVTDDDVAALAQALEDAVAQIVALQAERDLLLSPPEVTQEPKPEKTKK